MIKGYCPQCKHDQEANDIDCCVKCGTALIEPYEYIEWPIGKILITLTLIALFALIAWYSRH